MTLRHWDAPCRILHVTELKDEVILTIELLAPYGDGSGRKGQRLNINPNQLNADGGWKELSNTILNSSDQSRKEEIMSAVENSYDNKSLKELTELYNSMVPEKNKVKKFKDKATAIARMTKAFQNPVGAASSKSTVHVESAEKVPAKLAKAATVVAQQFKLVGRKSNHAGKKIFKLRKDNPRREGSEGYKNWEIYRDGMTYEEFKMAKGGSSHLNWDIEKGFVELK